MDRPSSDLLLPDIFIINHCEFKNLESQKVFDTSCFLPVTRNRKAVDYSVFQDDDDEDFACEKPPPKKARTAVKDLDSESNCKSTSASPNEVVDLTSSGSKKRTFLGDKLYERDLEAALTLSLLDSSRTQDGEPTTKTEDCDASQPVQCSPPVLIHCSADGSHLDLDSESNRKSTSASPNEVVDLTSSGSKKRTFLDDKLHERDLEAALTLSLLDSSRTQDGEPTTKTEDCDASQPIQCSPPVLIHCSADGSHLVGDSHPHPDCPPVLSNCSIDDRSLGLNLISVDASPPSVSKQTEASEKQRKPLKKKDNKDDEDYQLQNTPDSESDADFTEEEESEDETFTMKKKVVKQKTEKKAPPPVKDKREKKEKKPTNASKAKISAPCPTLCRSPAGPVSGLKKTPNTPPVSKPALCSSPAGGRLPKWNPPGLVGRIPGASQNASMKSPGQGLRLGLSRLARVKPLHHNAAVN
ncbi:RAD51-associated protein 1 [Anabarilius grahami]|uniref:RAD51-associated protein 1 n=1 Tax=Anabarilius grahami TaxID=495550 RepID=A0A3N0Z271_ANAGA|nr:RAD51-associated protein 1 [Anabarilius grahami]